MEDNSADVLLIRRALRISCPDAELHCVTDGQQAIRVFEALDADHSLPCPSLVILDINLPRHPGSDVLQYLRASQRCSHARVLVVSTSGAKKDREKMEELGADGYFQKPAEVAEFMKLGEIVKAMIECAD